MGVAAELRRDRRGAYTLAYAATEALAGPPWGVRAGGGSAPGTT